MKNRQSVLMPLGHHHNLVEFDTLGTSPALQNVTTHVEIQTVRDPVDALSLPTPPKLDRKNCDFRKRGCRTVQNLKIWRFLYPIFHATGVASKTLVHQSIATRHGNTP